MAVLLHTFLKVQLNCNSCSTVNCSMGISWTRFSLL